LFFKKRCTIAHHLLQHHQQLKIEKKYLSKNSFMAIDNFKLLFSVLPYNCTIYIYPTKLIFVGEIIVTSNTIYSSRIHGYIETIADL